MYRSPESGKTVTIVFPANSGSFASLTAATAAPLPRVGKDGTDRLPREFRKLRESHCRHRSRSARNPAENAFLARQAPRHLDGLVIGDLFHAIHKTPVQILRDKY